MALLKIARLLHPRNLLLHKRLVGEDVKDSPWLRGINTFAGSSPFKQNNAADAEKLKNRVFAPYSVFKGKAALSANPIRPTFSKLDSGGVKIDRRGVIMLTFWPAVAERKYDWDKRQLFALSPTEIGSLISLGPRDSCEFFHDPSMLSSNAGQVRKSLSIKPNADGTGYFVSLNVVNNILKINDRFAVPVTTAEFAVMRTAFSFALPHIMGWDSITNQPSESISQSPPKVVAQVRDSEWDR